MKTIINFDFQCEIVHLKKKLQQCFISKVDNVWFKMISLYNETVITTQCRQADANLTANTTCNSKNIC